MLSKSFDTQAEQYSPMEQLVNNTHFGFSCKDALRCISSRYLRPGSWENSVLMKTFFYVQTALGFPTIVFNLVVFGNILVSKSLRQNVSMLFVCNMALCDLLLGLFFTVQSLLVANSDALFQRQECWKIGFLWLLGQISTIFTTLFLTLERYLVCVFIVNPNVRISRRLAIVCIIASWFVALFATGCGVYWTFFTITEICIAVYIRSTKSSSFYYFSVVLYVFGVTSYFITFIFYIRIYIVARRASQNAGVNRESKLARRIAVLVLSNVFFFFLPAIVYAVFTGFDSHSLANNCVKKLITIHFPVAFLCINSFLNPILHAFRNDRFRQALRERIANTGQCIRSHCGASQD